MARVASGWHLESAECSDLTVVHNSAQLVLSTMRKQPSLSRNVRLVIYLKPDEFKTAKALAKKAGLRTPNQWIIMTAIRAMVLQ